MKSTLRPWLMFLLSIMMIACDESASVEELKARKPEGILRNLPTQDREYLLEPLEGAFDDLREVAEYDPSLFESKYSIDTNGYEGEVRFKLRGSDTALIDARIRTANTKEHHQQYWDDEGHLFLLESTIHYVDVNGSKTSSRAYRLYFEEGLQRLSAYGKVSFDGDPLPDDWVTICPTREEQQFLLSAYKRMR